MPAMDYIAHAGSGGADVLHLVQMEAPRPGPGELLLRVLAAGVNRPDIFQRKGFYPPPAGASPILGLEVAGEIVEVGEGVPRQAIGKRVCALVNGGGYAQYVAVPQGQCLRWPKGYNAIQAAALPETAFTVWYNLFELGGLQAEQSVLVHGGSGGIGTAAIQYATALGARVFVTAGSAERCARCVDLGAAAAIDYRSQDFAAAIAQLTGGRGVDVVLDMIGAQYLERNLASLADGGRLVFIAFLGGATAEQINLSPIMHKRLRLTGSTLRPRSPEEKAAIAAALNRVIWPLLDSGIAAPPIHAVYPLAEAAAAHRAMEQGEHFGKIVLRVAEG